MDSPNSQTTPATTSTSLIRQLLGAADAQTAHPATCSTAPAHPPLGSANAETTPPSSDRALLGLSADEQFSPVPSAQVYLGQNYSSAPIKTQGQWGGGVDSKTVKRPRQQPAQPPKRQLLGAADAQTAHPATFSTAPTHQLLGSANAETTPAGAPAAAADRTQRPDATCEGENG